MILKYLVPVIKEPRWASASLLRSASKVGVFLKYMKRFLGFRGLLTLLTVNSVRYYQGRLDFKWLRTRSC